MAWTVEYLPSATRALKKLDRQAGRRILDFMRDRVAHRDDPREIGKALTGRFGGFWRCRVGDHRVVCDIQDRRLIILVIEIGDRKDVYR